MLTENAFSASALGLLARAFGYANMAPWIIGLGLSQIGEFSFALARSGLASGLLSKPTYDLALTSTRLPDGTVTSEVARRQSDGTWLWVIDRYSVAW